MDFALGLLARVSEGQKKAAAAEKRRAAAAVAARRRAADERAQRDRERAQQGVNRMMARSRPKPRIPRRRSAPKKTAAAKRPVTPEEAATRLRAASAQRSAREVARERQRKNTGPPKPMKGMQFVERRDKKKEINVPHTSDYSDLFGDDYLVGIDLKCVTKMKEESAKAAKEAEKIHAEHEAQRQKRLKEAEEIAREAAEMKRRGVNQKETNMWRLKATEKDWVAVDIPTNALTPSERAHLKGSSSSAQPSRLGVASNSGITKVSKAKREAIGAAEMAKKKAALRQSILAATGGAKPARTNRVRSVSSSPERRPMPSGKRKRALDDDRRSLDRRSGDRRPAERRLVSDRKNDRYARDDRRPKKPRYDDRNMGYNSDEWGDELDGDDDDDDEEDLFGIEALDREEEESARLAAIEDRRELRLEAQRRKEKKRRREEYERRL